MASAFGSASDVCLLDRSFLLPLHRPRLFLQYQPIRVVACAFVVADSIHPTHPPLHRTLQTHGDAPPTLLSRLSAHNRSDHSPSCLHPIPLRGPMHSPAVSVGYISQPIHEVHRIKTDPDRAPVQVVTAPNSYHACRISSIPHVICVSQKRCRICMREGRVD